jgi:hypothetical protein
MSVCSCDPDEQFNLDCYEHGPAEHLRLRVHELSKALERAMEQLFLYKANYSASKCKEALDEHGI